LTHKLVITVRPAAISDAVQLAEIQVAAWHAAYRGMVPDAALDAYTVEDRAARWNEILRAGMGETLVSETAGVTTGWIGFGASRDEDSDGSTGEVYGLYVAPGRWRSGAGTALWRAACARMSAQGFAAVDVWVLEANAPARRFYESVGCALQPGMTKMFEGDGYAVPEVRYTASLD
jgi:ribosomal protein S18 acetylase RimI-like enzyme